MTSSYFQKGIGMSIKQKYLRDENGNLKEECCGPYNFNYREYLEYKFCLKESEP